MKYLIGNWKAHKNLREAQLWLDQFLSHDIDALKGSVEVIVCPPFPFIEHFAEQFSDYEHLHVGAQDISKFGAGSYTGEVSAHTLQDLVDYVLIGHSERRKHFNEEDNIVDQKVQNARGAQIEPIAIVRDQHDTIPPDVTFLAYEPVDHIGTGHAQDIDEILEMKKKLGVDSNMKFIYGGSSNPQNARDIVQSSEVDGLLPGGSSLDPDTFFSMAERMSHLSD